jgi:hypothetical protein
MNGHVDKYLDHGVVGIAHKDSPVYVSLRNQMVVITQVNPSCLLVLIA